MTIEPTVELPDGVTSRTVNESGVIYFRDAQGKLHNPDGPALLSPDKATYWLMTGRDPREKGDWWFGHQVWYRHGVLHRTDGPAVMRGDGTTEYRVDGEFFTADEFHEWITDSVNRLATDDQPCPPNPVRIFHTGLSNGP